MPTSPIVQLLVVLAVVGCAFGMWKGDLPERVGALIILLNMALTLFVGSLLDGVTGYLFNMVLDGLTAVAFLLMTMQWGRVWLGAAMLIYAAQFGLRSYYLVTDRPHDNLHALVNNVNFFALVVCIVVGTLLAWRGRSAAAARG
jgi:small-conductance mechanosensitive channel